MSIAMSVLERLVNGINEEKLGAYGVDVLIGDDAVQHRWRSDDRENIYSVSKGVCALAVGMAIDEGLLSLESTVPELLPAMELGAGVETVTIRHLLSMSSGIDFAWFGDQPPGLEDGWTGCTARGSKPAVARLPKATASLHGTGRATVGGLTVNMGSVVIDDAQNAVVTITAHEESRDWRLTELAHLALTGR